MVKYRSSRFHNAKNGRRLAKLMAVAVAFTRNPKRTKTINGITYELDLREVIDSSLYFTSTYEVKIDRLFEKYVKPGSTVIDIGANIGLHTLRSAQLVGRTGLVIAIEPSSWAVRKLNRNLESNPELKPRVAIQQFALGETPQLSVPIGFQSSYPLNGRKILTQEITDIVTLDQVAKNHSLTNLSVIKIDVDGLELAVLRGAARTLTQCRPTLICEFTPSYSDTYLSELAYIEEFLIRIGYSAYTDEERPIAKLAELLSSVPHEKSEMILFK